MVCKCLSAELWFLEKISKYLVYISTWEVMNQWQQWEEEEKAVEGELRLSWHKFESHIMWQVSWQHQCSRAWSEQIHYGICALWGPMQYWFFLDWCYKCRDLFAMKWQRDIWLWYQWCNTESFWVKLPRETVIPARPPKAVLNTSYNSYTMRNGNALKWDLAALSLEFIWSKLLTLLTQDNKNWLEPHK